MKNYKKIRFVLHESDITQEQLAEILGRSASYVSARFRGKESFTIDECYKVLQLCDIAPEHIFEYFPPLVG